MCDFMSVINFGKCLFLDAVSLNTSFTPLYVSFPQILTRSVLEYLILSQSS